MDASVLKKVALFEGLTQGQLAKVASIAELETALAKAKNNDKTTVLVIDTDPLVSTDAGGHWWDVAVPEVSARREVNAARKKYEEAVGSRQG